MIKKVALLLSITFGLVLVAPVNPANAWNLFPQKVCESGNKQCADLCAGEGAKSALCEQAKNQNKDDNPVARLIGAVANLIALIAGVVAVVMIILAGFQFITSGGNSEQATKARGRIIGAIIGLVIIALAWTIIRLVTDTVLT